MADKMEDIPVEVKNSDASPLEQFVEHQTRALQEVGRAAISLVPEGLRQHGWNALEESAKGFGALLGVVSDTVNEAASALKKEVVPPTDNDKES